MLFGQKEGAVKRQQKGRVPVCSGPSPPVPARNTLLVLRFPPVPHAGSNRDRRATTRGFGNLGALPCPHTTGSSSKHIHGFCPAPEVTWQRSGPGGMVLLRAAPNTPLPRTSGLCTLGDTSLISPARSEDVPGSLSGHTERLQVAEGARSLCSAVQIREGGVPFLLRIHRRTVMSWAGS